MKADLTDLASPKLEKLKKGIQQTGRQSTVLGAAFGDLKGKASEMGVPLDKMEAYFGAMPKAALGTVAAVGAVGAGMVALGMHAIQVGADLQDMSDTTGLSVESLSSMRNVLAASNMDTKGYSDAISKLNIKLGENGKYLKKQGIDITDSEKAFDQLKHKIADIEDPIKRSELANKAFGKSYKDLMPLLTMANGEYDKMKGNTSVFSSEFAANAAKVDDNLALLKTTFSDFGVQLGANFIPLMESLVGILQEAADFWGAMANGPSADQKKANDLDAIRVKYADVQAESDKGSKVLGQSPHDVKIDGKTFAQAVRAYMDSVKAQEAEEAKSLEAKKKKAEADKKAAELAESALASAEARQKLIDANNYSSYLKGQREQDYKDTQAALNAQRYSTEYGNAVDYFGGDDTSMRNYQDDYNRSSDNKAALVRHQETLSNTVTFDAQAKEGNAAYDAQLMTEEIEKQNEALERQSQIWDKIESGVGSLVTGPLDDFYKHIGSANKDLFSNFSSLFSNIQDAFGNMLAKMAAELTTKAAIFGVLNLLSGGGVGFATSALSGFSWFANGTDYAYGGPALVGERGPELVNLPKGSTVTPIGQSTQSPTYHITIQQGAGMSSEDVVREIKRYDRENRGR